MLRTIRAGLATAAVLAAVLAPLAAQSPDEVGELKKQIEALKKSQAALEKQVTDLRRTVRRLDPSSVPEGLKLSLAGAHIKGSEKARLTIVEFSDYQ